MKIKFLYIENGKITLTKKELEQLLEESYQDGVAEGRKSNNSYGHGLTYQNPRTELNTPEYETTPYWDIDRAIPVTCEGSSICNNEIEAVRVNGGALDQAAAGTVTIFDCCEADSTIGIHATDLNGEVCGSTTHAYNTLYTHTDTTHLASITTDNTATEGK